MPDNGVAENAEPEAKIGSYRLLQQLGSGGMSSVFRAVHTETGHEVAVKVLPRYLAKNPTLLQRFIREARSAESLEHPQIVAIYDRGSDQGRYYLVLEYIQGGDLHDRVRAAGPLGVVEAVELIKTAAQGLSYAASRGVIHRDVKPANLLLTPNGQVKITDLGLALQVEDEDERVTRDGTTVGTVDYMSPEQARDSRATSVRSDIYSLGCTFYFLLTGSPPFPGGDLTDKLRRHAIEPAPDVRAIRPDVPPSLSRLIRRMMEKSPDRRFEDYEHLIDELDALPDAELNPDEPQLVPLDDEPNDFSPGVRRPGSSALNPGSRAENRPFDNPRPPQSGPTWPTSSSRAISTADSQHAASPLLREILDDEEEENMPPQMFGASRDSSDVSTQDAIVRGILIGMVIALLFLGIHFSLPYLSAGRGNAPIVPANPPVADDASKPGDSDPEVPQPNPAGPSAEEPRTTNDSSYATEAKRPDG